jgi:hypothetical protein
MRSLLAVSARSTAQNLRQALTEVASFMDARSLPYAEEVRKALAEVSTGDAHGARRYPGLNRALLDISFDPLNQNARDEQEAEVLQREWERLHGRAYSIAQTLVQGA